VAVAGVDVVLDKFAQERFDFVVVTEDVFDVLLEFDEYLFLYVVEGNFVEGGFKFLDCSPDYGPETRYMHHLKVLVVVVGLLF
jgi:hypothetical protein